MRVLSLQFSSRDHPFARRTLLCATLLWALALTGCEAKPSSSSSPSSSSPSSPSPVIKAQSKDVADDKAAGKEAPARDQAPQRVISLAPNLTEITYALGAGDRLRAVTRFCDYPESAKKLPKVGGLIDPDVEVMVKHKPDLVMGMASGPTQALPAKLDAVKLSYVFVQMRTIEETYRGIEVVGDHLGKSEEARALVRHMKSKMVPHQVQGTRPKVLFVLGHKPLIVAGHESFGGELIQMAGGENAAPKGKPYPALDLEQLLTLNPEVIIDATMTPQSAQRDFWTSKKNLAAVKADRVHRLHDGALLRPGPRLVQALALMKHMIRPKDYPKP